MTTAVCDVYTSLSELLEYPAGDLLACAASCRLQLADQFSEAASEIQALESCIEAMEQGALEEMYTATFDLAPSCTPYLSVHLFGAENYKRGELMARLNGMYADYEFSGGAELPDHLAVLLRFLPRLPEEERGELIRHCLLAPVQTMIGILQKSENPYCHVLRAVQHVLAGVQAACPDLSGSRLRVEDERLAGGTPALRQERDHA
ncbi:MAG: nitrate reductase molybdenum cofactor assembly chaperone [Armatimonadota bacterium]